MSRERIFEGSSFEQRIGYSRAVVDGRWVFVSGTTGYDYTTMTISDDVVEQCHQTLANIDDAWPAPALAQPTPCGFDTCFPIPTTSNRVGHCCATTSKPLYRRRR